MMWYMRRPTGASCTLPSTSTLCCVAALRFHDHATFVCKFRASATCKFLRARSPHGWLICLILWMTLNCIAKKKMLTCTKHFLRRWYIYLRLVMQLQLICSLPFDLLKVKTHVWLLINHRGLTWSDRIYLSLYMVTMTRCTCKNFSVYMYSHIGICLYQTFKLYMLDYALKSTNGSAFLVFITNNIWFLFYVRPVVNEYTNCTKRTTQI